MIQTAIKLFGLILGAAIASAILGGLFGMALALVSPDFVSRLFFLEDTISVPRYAFSMGMVWGLFIGVAVGLFASICSIILNLIKLKVDFTSKR